VTEENLRDRTCATCACVFIVQPPRVPTAAQLAADPELPNRKSVLICRLNPPSMVRFQLPPHVAGGPPVMVDKLMQPQTDVYFSCWQWRGAGTLPGDRYPGESDVRDIGVRKIQI
jgi:hypothetical protein